MNMLDFLLLILCFVPLIVFLSFITAKDTTGNGIAKK